MSSAEDKSSSTITPLAGTANSTPEEFPIESNQHEGEKPTASPSAAPEPPIELDEDTAGPLKTKPLPRVNAAARQVSIRATGARAGDVSGERELFSELTSTVLVFEKGGVIRLAAAVTPGQLLFLTNEESKREIVAQVVRKRAYRPTECYVELEFTEPAPGFWGMEFSAATALLPKDENEVAAAELVASAETTADEPEEATAPPSAEEVQALKNEVEALRSQLKQLQGQSEPVPPPPSPAPSGAPEASSVSAIAAKPEPPAPSPEPSPHTGFSTKSLPLDTEPAPSWSPPAEQRPAAKPAMVFRKSLPPRKRSFRARGQFTPGFRTGMLRLAALTAILAAVIGVSWYKRWLPGMHKMKKIEVSTWVGGVTTATQPQRTQPVATASRVIPATRPDSGTRTPDSPTGSGGVAPSNNSQGKNAAESESGPVLPQPTVVERPPAAREKPTSSVSAMKHSPAKTSTAKVVDSVPTAVQDANLIPPKLVKFERAVVSLNDMRDFETGSVIIDAIVDTEGDVKLMSVRSGPPSLRKPALEALKNYKYKPATLNGKPVPARVTVKIQFHFEP